jgi:hypothetical protein
LKADAELGPFVRLIEALEPWLDQVVLIGGWAHRLYRLDPRAQRLTYPPLTTLDTDIAIPSKIEAKGTKVLAEEFTDEYCFDIAIVPQGLYSPGYNSNVLIFPHRVRWKTYKYENFQPYGNSDGTRY